MSTPWTLVVVHEGVVDSKITKGLSLIHSPLTLTCPWVLWGRCEKNYLPKEEGREGGEKSVRSTPDGPGSNVVNYVLWLPNLVRRIPDASLWWWWPSWRSKVIRGQMRKLCAMATKLSQKKPWCKFMMMMTFMKVKGHQRLNVVNIALWLPNLVRKNPWCKFMIVMTFMKVRGHQRSNVVNFALCLPNLVNRIANASFK